MIKLVENAPAKINLTLDVLAKRPDGYHEVRMIMQSISLSDRIELAPSNEVELTCSNAELPTDDRNIAVRAAKAILADSGKGVKIYLQKHIPLEAGMAGGSTDAAAVLRGINKLYSLGKSKHELLNIAKSLGADVPFCLEGGTALAEGIGEKLTPLPAPPKLWLLLIKPSFGVSTALVYKSLKLDEVTAHPNTKAAINALQLYDRNALISNLHNVLEEVTFKLKPELISIKQNLSMLGAENVLMSGSGPTIFGIFPDQSTAEATAEKYTYNGAFVTVAHTL